MDTTTNQVISRSLVCVWVTGTAFPPNWTTLPHGQHMYTWSPASWKSGQPSTTRLCHTLDNHPDNHPLAGQKHIKLPALTSVGILGNDYYWIDGKGSIGWVHAQNDPRRRSFHPTCQRWNHTKCHWCHIYLVAEYKVMVTCTFDLEMYEMGSKCHKTPMFMSLNYVLLH